LVDSIGGLAMPTLYSHGDPTDAEQYLLELINRARSDPPAEANRYGIDLNEGPPSKPISPDPVPPLPFNQFLMKAATGQSQRCWTCGWRAASRRSLIRSMATCTRASSPPDISNRFLSRRRTSTTAFLRRQTSKPSMTPTRVFSRTRAIQSEDIAGHVPALL
jgi:hypothetical protein